MITRVVLDLDDAYPGNDRMGLLRELKYKIPNLKVTLFAIPGRCDAAWVREMNATQWVEIVPHGWLHQTNRECERWTENMMHACIRDAEEVGFTIRGFKAPGWQISDDCYSELLRSHYWVADQTYNNARRPAGLRTYLIGDPPPGVVQIHGHVGHLNGHNANEIEYLVPEILKHRYSEWAFVSEVVA